MGASRQRATSLLSPQGAENLACSVAGGKDDQFCVVGGCEDCTAECNYGILSADCGGGSRSAGKAEMLTGSDALRFLCANSAAQNGRIDGRPSYVKLFSRLSTKEIAESYLPISPPLSIPPRSQRKAHRPSRIPPHEHVELSPSQETSALLRPAVLSKKHRRTAKRIGIVDACTENGSAPLPTEDGKNCKRLNPPSRLNASPVCENLACRAVLHPEASFCKRCSCCICKEFDDNKDPSLWITCDRDEEGCGLSCHAECALQNGTAGVVEKEGSVWLDGSFLCESCGKISTLISLWRRQLLIAKAARRVDVLCLRLSLSHRLLDGTLKYKEAHSTLDKAVKKLEAEVSLMKKDSAKLKRCIVKRLSCDAEVQGLIDLSLEQAENLADAQSIIVGGSANLAATQGQALCTLQFEDVCSTSVIVVAVDAHASDHILGYKLWLRRTTDRCYPTAPTYIIPKSSKKIIVSELQSCTSYVFKVSPFSAQGDHEECEAECCTKGIDSTLEENHANSATTDGALKDAVNVCHAAKSSTDNLHSKSSMDSESVELASSCRFEDSPDNLYNVQDLISEADEGKKDQEEMEGEHPFVMQTLTRNSFVNWAIFNQEFEVGRGLCISRNGISDKANIFEVDMNVMENNRGSYPWAMQLHCPEAQRPMLTTHREFDVHGLRSTVSCIEEFTIKLVRWLECRGHLDNDFRRKFLTWYSLRASEQEKRVVSVFIDTLQNNPRSLAAQLVDTFQDIVYSKRQRSAELVLYNRAHQ